MGYKALPKTRRGEARRSAVVGRRLVTDPYGSGRLQDAAAGDPYVCILRPMGPRVLTYAAAGIHMEPDGSIWIRSKGIHMDPVEGDPYGFL